MRVSGGVAASMIPKKAIMELSSEYSRVHTFGDGFAELFA